MMQIKACNVERCAMYRGAYKKLIELGENRLGGIFSDFNFCHVFVVLYTCNCMCTVLTNEYEYSIFQCEYHNSLQHTIKDTVYAVF